MTAAILGPIAKDKVKIDGRLSVQIGGIPYYVGRALQALGAQEVAPYVACGVEDKDWVKENFSDLAVNFLPADHTLISNIAYSSNNPDVRDSFIEPYSNPIVATEELLAVLEHFDWIIFGPLFHDDIDFNLFKRLSHKLTAMDNFGMFTYSENGKMVRQNPENLHRVLPFLNYLFLDREEAYFVSGRNNIMEAARFLQAKGLKNLIITEGSLGSHLFIGHDYYRIPAFPPRQLADTTGAGDTYMAAFLRARELFEDPAEQGRFAAMAATMSLEGKGAFHGSVDEINDRLNLV
ncbi:MAG: PfkB family carbohydrate kinase [Patescibacteria group bacterium]